MHKTTSATLFIRRSTYRTAQQSKQHRQQIIEIILSNWILSRWNFTHAFKHVRTSCAWRKCLQKELTMLMHSSNLNVFSSSQKYLARSILRLSTSLASVSSIVISALMAWKCQVDVMTSSYDVILWWCDGSVEKKWGLWSINWLKTDCVWHRRLKNEWLGSFRGYKLETYWFVENLNVKP